jgi:hypothetical protein
MDAGGLITAMDQLYRTAQAQLDHLPLLQSSPAQWTAMHQGLQDTEDLLQRAGTAIGPQWPDAAGQLYAQRIQQSGTDVQRWRQALEAAAIGPLMAGLGTSVQATADFVSQCKEAFDALVAAFSDTGPDISGELADLVDAAQQAVRQLDQAFGDAAARVRAAAAEGTTFARPADAVAASASTDGAGGAPGGGPAGGGAVGGGPAGGGPVGGGALDGAGAVPAGAVGTGAAGARAAALGSGGGEPDVSGLVPAAPTLAGSPGLSRPAVGPSPAPDVSALVPPTTAATPSPVNLPPVLGGPSPAGGAGARFGPARAQGTLFQRAGTVAATAAAPVAEGPAALASDAAATAAEGAATRAGGMFPPMLGGGAGAGLGASGAPRPGDAERGAGGPRRRPGTGPVGVPERLLGRARSQPRDEGDRPAPQDADPQQPLDDELWHVAPAPRGRLS